MTRKALVAAYWAGYAGHSEVEIADDDRVIDLMVWPTGNPLNSHAREPIIAGGYLSAEASTGGPRGADGIC